MEGCPEIQSETKAKKGRVWRGQGRCHCSCSFCLAAKMTVGRPAGAPGSAECSRQIFPPKSSSDTEAEDELSGDGLVLPRAGKLHEFLSPEEEADSTSDSTESFCETLHILKQKGGWGLLESLFSSDPNSDENVSEDEDLESFFQDKGRGRPQVWRPSSQRCGSRRRCSSLSSLPCDTPKAQTQLVSGSAPPSQHRSISSWASSVTVPRPFRMTLREAQKKAQWLASPASFELERQKAQRQGQEEAECHQQFRAQPVPAHVYLPLYQEIMERSEARRQAGIQKRKELLLSSLKPFSFLEKEEQRKEAARQRDSADTDKTKVSNKKATRRIPKSVLEPALGDKLEEAELFRKIRIQMRALDMLHSASSPVLSSSRPDSQPRTAARTWEKKLGFLQTNFGFQPRVNPVIPDYDGLYKAFQSRAAKRRETREVTHNKPFSLRTANLRHSPRSCDTSAAEGRRGSLQPPAAPLPRSCSLSGLASLSTNTLPVHITDAARKRESAVRRSLEKKEKADESIQWLQMHKKKCQALSKSVTLRAKAMDPHKSLEEVFKAKLKENRNNDRKRAKEYKKELEEMKKRIQTRPYLFEQVSKDLARKEAEQRYRDTLKQAGLEEDFVRNKSRGRAVRWKGEAPAKDPPSISESTKLNIRDPQQDLEEFLEQLTSPKEDLEILSYESPDNLKASV
ncbi:protein FAM161B [Fukomys damarensis]|uniref:Protein FAM161B n=1 Tax=Fukomys damarensis TaxID=885580 RepID=A0A091D262_FUKDA|nr:protein FAM161B [Fukomys damarensis]KFO24240.1 Protein FAM161B [Fukomys damarensis]